MNLFATERLFLTADGKVVEEGDSAAAFLFAGKGDEIPAADAEKLGLTAKSPGVSPSDPRDPKPPAKEAEPPADKQADPPANKGRRA